MSQYVSTLFLGFTLKCFICGLSVILLRRKCEDYLEASIAAWLLVQIGLIAVMLVLSAFHQLTGFSLWTVLIASACFLFIMSFTLNKPISGTNRRGLGLGPLVDPVFIASMIPVMIIFAVLAYRSFYFFDTTWDGMTYENTRISAYAQNASLFIHMPTKAMNIFSNEWNGEVNCLFYLLLTGTDQAINFGNVEIWLIACMGYAWLGGLLGTPTKLRILTGLILSCAPPLLGVSMTVKGDLLCIAAFAISAGWIYRIIRDGAKPLYVLLALGSLGLSFGAKMVVAVSTFCFCLIILSYQLKQIRRKGIRVSSSLFAGMILFGIGSSRYIVNFFTYGSPFARLEAASLSGSHFLGNAWGICHSFGEAVLNGPWPAGTTWHLSMNYGFMGLLIIAYLFTKIVKLTGTEKTSENSLDLLLPSRLRRRLIFIIPLILGFLFLAFSTGWRPWSLRYFIPWIQILLTAALVDLYESISGRGVIFFLTISIVLIPLHMSMVFRSGEGMWGTFAEARQRRQIERKLAPWPYLLESIDGNKSQKPFYLEIDRLPPQRILVFNNVDSPTYLFYGEDRQHHVDFVNTKEKLLNGISSGQYDLAAISFVITPPFPYSDLQGQNVNLIVDNKYLKIFRIARKPSHR